MPMVGADLAELQSLIQRLAGPMKSELDSQLSSMNSAVEGSAAYWTGNNSNKFRADFAHFVSTTNANLNRVLEEAAKAAGSNLQAIEAATGSSA